MTKNADNYQKLLTDYIEYPNNPESNWNIGWYYDRIGQTASAVSFYLRCAERTDDDLLRFECLLRSALCFQKQGSRNFTVKGLLQHAVSIQPQRPEGYFLLSRHYEREKYDGHWNDCYTVASIGENICKNDSNSLKPLRTNVEYPDGEYGLLFEKAVSSWWCGLCDESRELFTDLYLNYALDDSHYNSVHANLRFLKSPIGQYAPFSIYRFYDYERLRLKFSNSKDIQRNYSEAFQDLFVLTMLNGKKKGTYLEIGAGHPVYGNNTYLLETVFGWSGTSIDYNSDLVDDFNKKRVNECINADATKLDYSELIDTDYIDYLQIDCDPPEVTYQTLLKLDLKKTKFGVITFEHDNYADSTKSIQNLAHDYLSRCGYTPIVKNISPDGIRSYEDWWVHPDYVDAKIIDKFKKIVKSTNDIPAIFTKQLFLT